MTNCCTGNVDMGGWIPPRPPGHTQIPLPEQGYLKI